jgi:hypothetical protein
MVRTMSPLSLGAGLLVALLTTACGDDAQGGPTDDDGGSGGSGGGSSCDGAGKPEMTGPITGLVASYAAGDPIDIGVPVDEDTRRVTVGVYEVGSTLYLGGTAEDASPGSTRTLSLFAGVAGGATGTFYLLVELCSTSLCTTPFVRNVYQRADGTAPALASGEPYVQARENVGGPDLVETCPTEISIQSFLIE